jgi:hypothetical protein
MTKQVPWMSVPRNGNLCTEKTLEATGKRITKEIRKKRSKKKKKR